MLCFFLQGVMKCSSSLCYDVVGVFVTCVVLCHVIIIMVFLTAVLFGCGPVKA